MSLSLVGAPAGFTLSPTGTLSVAATAPTGAIALVYQICETAAANNCATATIALVVRPVPVNDVIAVQSGQPNTGNVSGNDNMPAGSTWSVLAPPQGLVFNSNGSFTYTHRRAPSARSPSATRPACRRRMPRCAAPRRLP